MLYKHDSKVIEHPLFNKSIPNSGKQWHAFSRCIKISGLNHIGSFKTDHISK